MLKHGAYLDDALHNLAKFENFGKAENRGPAAAGFRKRTQFRNRTRFATDLLRIVLTRNVIALGRAISELIKARMINLNSAPC